MTLLDTILISIVVLYFIIGGFILSLFAASCLKDPEIKNCDKYKAADFFLLVYAIWPIIVYWELKSRWQKKIYQRLKQKFDK